MAKLESLIDAFTAAAVNTGVWSSSTVGQYTLDTVNDLVTLNVGTTAGTYNSFGTGGFYDATASSLYAQITVAPSGNGGTQTILKLSKDSNNGIQFSVSSGGAFIAQVVTAGSYATTNLPTYDPHAHRWWRFTEAAGSFALATSPDGLNWTTLTTLAYTWSATAVQVYFQTGVTDTEPSGMTAAIQHVNTRLGGTANPNWPTIEDAWAPFWNANGGDSPLDRYVEITDRTRNSVTVSRGRQYELDQVRSGEASLTLANTDAALDPVNAAGPWYGHIAPYQPYRRRAQWPPTRNMLTQVQATGGDLGGYSAGTIPGGSAGIDVFSLTDSGGGTITASSSAWQGGNVFQFSVPNGTATQTAIGFTRQPAVQPGITYTVQMRVRNVTASTSQQVDAFITFADVPGATTTVRSSVVTLTGNATAAWTLLTVTGTAPAGTARMAVGVETGGAAAATCSVQVDGWQLEKGATSTSWVCPGVWNPVYAGYMERWPSSWGMSGTYGLVQPTAVDAFSLLSQKQLTDPLTQEINNNSPRFVYKLDDPAGSTSVADWTGHFPAAPLAISKYGAGSLTFGNAITATDATGIYTGSGGTVVTVNNSNPGTALTTGGATFIKLTAAGIRGPADPTLWTRMIAFRYTGPMPTAHATLWSAMDNVRSGGFPAGSQLHFVITSTGRLQLWLYGPTGTSVALDFDSSTSVVDGDWHLAIAAFNASSQIVDLHLDTVRAFYGSVNPALTPTGIDGDNLGGYVDITVGNGTTFNYKGDLAFCAEFPAQLSQTAATNLYSAWRSACSGESTSARYSRILGYAGYTGPSTVQTGLTTSMGPANLDGQDAVSALQAVVDTEGGEHFVDRQGFVQFKARSARYNALTPAYVFGENPGEWPYEDVTLDYDSTHLSNQVTVTQEGTSQNFYAQDATSGTNYFPRSMSRTINSSSTLECQDAANYLLSRYKMPATRVSSVKLHPSANPALWPVCLALELGTRVRVMRRAPGVPATQIECFVENIGWDFGDDGEAFQTLQCSPADLTPYGVFSSWHTTLKNAITAGATTLTINPSQDNTNALAAQLAVGEVITLDPGTAVSENVTVSAIGATSPGWTSAVITLTAGTVNAHGVGAVICDQLPAGTTSATTWDAVSMFDSTAFAY